MESEQQNVIINRYCNQISCKECLLCFSTESEYNNHKEECQTDDFPATVDALEENYNENSGLSCTTSSSLIQQQTVIEEVEHQIAKELKQENCQSHISAEEDQIFAVIEDDEMGEIQDDPPSPLNVPDNIKFFCQYCSKGFVSRSGRDLHVQIKHKVPDDLSLKNIENDEIEIINNNGCAAKAWKCSTCGQVSKKKSHHQTHLIRHAIKEKETLLKNELQETGFVLMHNNRVIEQNQDDSSTSEMIDLDSAKSEHEVFQMPSSEIDIQNSSSAVTVKHFPKTRQKAVDCFALVEKSIDGTETISCSACGGQFFGQELADLHIQRYGKTGLCTSCTCNECHVIFSNERMFFRHQNHHSLKSIIKHFKYYECDICSTIFGSLPEYTAHAAIHIDDQNSAVFQYENTTQLEGGCEVIMERLDEFSNGCWHCGHCVIEFAEKADLNLHLTMFHAALICPFDNLPFLRSIGYFVEHLKSKHIDKFSSDDIITFSCSHCHQEFTSKEGLSNHHGQCLAKPYECSSHCGKRFATQSQLRSHMNGVNGIKQHTCPYCDVAYAKKGDLTVHIRTHSNQKHYQCSLCTKSFRTNSNRSAHMEVHREFKSFRCSYCSEMFQTRGARRIHMKSHDRGDDLRCRMCLKDFRQKSHLVRHVQKSHGIECTAKNVHEAAEATLKKTKIES